MKLIMLILPFVLNTSFARQCPNPVDLKKFTEDPKAFLNAIPVKMDGNCVPRQLYADRLARATTPFSMGNMENLLRDFGFVDVKDEHRQKLCLESEDTDLCLKDLSPGSDVQSGRAPIKGLDRAENIVGENHISNLEEMEKQELKEGKIAKRPWSDWYWPIAVGQLSYRYADKSFEDAAAEVEVEEFWPTLYKNFQKNRPKSLDVNLLSPAEKYDLLVGDEDFSLANTMWENGRWYQDTYGKVDMWMGICHGWAPASYLLPRPKKSIEVLAADGKTKIKFRPTDLKALGSLLWANGNYSTHMIGGRCNDKAPEEDENGRILSDKCFDTNPGTWHKTIINRIGVERKSLVMDATYDYEVWNHPVISYEYSYFNPVTMKEVDTLKEATVEVSKFENDKFEVYRSSETKYIVGINMEVAYLVETFPSKRNHDRTTYDDFSYTNYAYDLELDADGNIIGGEWYTNKHPDFLWTPDEDYGVNSHVDRYFPENFELAWLKSAKSQRLREAAYYSSGQGQVVRKIIEKLFEKANAR